MKEIIPAIGIGLVLLTACATTRTVIVGATPGASTTEPASTGAASTAPSAGLGETVREHQPFGLAYQENQERP